MYDDYFRVERKKEMAEVRWKLACFVAAWLLGAPALAGDEGFNGRWNIRVDDEARKRVWWLQVEGAGTSRVSGKFVGAPGGDMDTIPEISVRDGELRFVFVRHYRGEDRDEKQRGMYGARLVGDKLVGTFGLEDEPAPRSKWVGERALEITDQDDGTWKAGTPIVLFDGQDLSKWNPVIPGRPLGWAVKQGILVNEPHANNIESKDKFWNFEAHLEYRLRAHSNSGVGLRGRYEVQIQDDYGKQLDSHGHGALYSRIAPRVNASKPAGEWQTLDIRLVGRYVTVVLNGTKIIDKGYVEGFTAMATDADEAQPGPLVIQGDHMPVEFRRITVTPLVKQTGN